MKKEYDFSKGVRGKYAASYHEDINKQKNETSILSLAGKYKDRVEAVDDLSSAKENAMKTYFTNKVKENNP